MEILFILSIIFWVLYVVFMVAYIAKLFFEDNKVSEEDKNKFRNME